MRLKVHRVCVYAQVIQTLTETTAQGRRGTCCILPTWGGSIPIQQVVILCGVKVHDDTGSIQQLLVTAGAGDAVIAVSAVSSVVELLRLHLVKHRYPE